MPASAADFDRRRFLGLAAAVASGVWFAPTLRAAEDPYARWRNSLIVNALGGIGNPNVREDDDDPSGLGESQRKRLRIDERERADLRASGLTAVNCTIGHVAGPGDPYARTVSEIAQYERLLQDYPDLFVKVLQAADIERARRERKVGLIYGFQNTSMIGDDLQRIDVFADLGVRVIQLTYNPANAVGDGAMAKDNRGLTPFGREVVARLNDCRLMVDLSHSGEKTCLDAARASKQPVSINHTGCRALVDLPRNKTDEELKLVAGKGGFVGIYFMPFLNPNGAVTADDVVAHIEHAVKVCGEDAVGFGSDGTTTQIDDLDAYRAVLARVNEERRKAGVAAPGEGPQTLPFAVDLRGANQYLELAVRLEKRGHGTARIEKILGGNFLRYAKAVWQ
ncbi:MAG TPA: membrane dipeptidase [Tahibacter sp.]|uniref:dipeptidase n=1 Tax=Tahibacter sp. TaxID=2056211 RepID=UPI002C5ADE6E|nr:membrane dipeptidase [Tahibacter sp.]HSX58912.1 membrane dipeptidase [Tahibacter sp.]